jgi:small-conductance mechanosensitive channel
MLAKKPIDTWKKSKKERTNNMNFGQNLYTWFLSNAQSLVLMAIVVIGIYLGFKREFSKLIGFLVVALVAVGLVFNAGGVKDVLLELFNKIIGA